MMHLAQINIGRVLGGPDDPRMADFYSNLARVNELAERMPGFVWRLKDDTGVAAMALHWPGDTTVNVNMSVWESPDALGKFVFQTVHRSIYARKHEFFETPKENTVALWWIPAGHILTLEEAKERLDHLNAHGPSDFAFGWVDLPSAKIFLEKKCA
jgi:hypothetical protein